MRLIFTAIALSSFIALVRPSPSVLRAAAMASVVLFARGVGKRSDPSPALGFAIAAVVIGDPWQARDPGFALSVLATAGLLLLSPRIEKWLSRYVPTFVASALSPPIAAVVMCAPILVALSGYLGPMAVIANLLAAPMVAPITIIGFVAALMSPISATFSSLLIFIIKWPARWIAGVAHWSADFPVLEIAKGVGGFIAGLILILGLIILFRSKKLVVVIFLSVVLLFAWLGQWPAGDWQIANCDVGQGDSLVVNLGDKRGLVVDAGPDAQLEDRCLTRLGITTVPLLILTHFHADHVEGVAGLVHNRIVGQVWVSNNSEPVFESARVAGWLKKSTVTVAMSGLSVKMATKRGPVTVRVLWPDDGSHAFDVLPGDGSAINNSSVAVEIASSDFSLFAGGDLEPSAQAAILSSMGHVDIYKVSHHGSVYQDEAFMERLSPAISVISVGAGNSYGHPAEQTIAALVRLRSKIYRTDKIGGIAITARAHHFNVHTSAGAWWQKVRLG